MANKRRFLAGAAATLVAALVVSACSVFPRSPTFPNGSGFFYEAPTGWKVWSTQQLTSDGIITSQSPESWLSISAAQGVSLKKIPSATGKPWAIIGVLPLTQTEQLQVALQDAPNALINIGQISGSAQVTGSTMTSGSWYGLKTEWTAGGMTIWEVSWVSLGQTTIADMVVGCSSATESTNDRVIQELLATFIPAPAK